jgi:hypothetical protein
MSGFGFFAICCKSPHYWIWQGWCSNVISLYPTTYLQGWCSNVFCVLIVTLSTAIISVPTRNGPELHIHHLQINNTFSFLHVVFFITNFVSIPWSPKVPINPIWVDEWFFTCALHAVNIHPTLDRLPKGVPSCLKEWFRRYPTAQVQSLILFSQLKIGSPREVSGSKIISRMISHGPYRPCKGRYIVQSLLSNLIFKSLSPFYNHFTSIWALV